MPNPKTKKIDDIPQELCRGLKGILFDIDDTFTFRGRIHPEPFSAMWEAREAGRLILPITGRPAGWADHIARMWPVDGVVGENGAFYFCFDRTEKRLKRHFVVEDSARREHNRNRLKALFKELQKAYPTITMASGTTLLFFFARFFAMPSFCQKYSQKRLDKGRSTICFMQRECQERGREHMSSANMANQPKKRRYS